MESQKTISVLRYVLQSCVLVFFVWLLADLSYPLSPESALLQWVSRLDPWLLLSQLRWQQQFPAWGWLPVLLLLATFLWGRVFCGWVCPWGAFLALTDKIGKTVFRNRVSISNKVVSTGQSMKYYWLLCLIIIFALGSNWVVFFTPFALFSHEIVRISQGDMPWLLMGITAGTLILSRFWCGVLCPTGILLSLVARWRLFRYQITGPCTHCGKCARVCSVNTVPTETGIAREECIVCGNCRRGCPAKAIVWQQNFLQNRARQLVSDSEISVAKNQPSRRQFFKTVFAITIAVVFWKRTVWSTGKALRPPGALPDADFTAVCNRCGRCMQVCPSKALRPMPMAEGIANFATPHIIPRQNCCDLCLACQTVCPTEAIVQTPLEQIRMGLAVIDRPRCLAWNESKLCFVCGEQCPVLAIAADEHHRPTILTDKCVGCGACEYACPVEGEAPIRVFPQ